MDDNYFESLGPEMLGASTQRAAMLACAAVVAIAAVVVAIAAVVIAYQEAQQTRFQRRNDCVAKFFAAFPNDPSGQLIEQARRRCYGLSLTSTTTTTPN